MVKTYMNRSDLMSNKKVTEKWEKDVEFSIEYTKHLHSEMTPFQQIEIYDSNTFGKFFTLDGYFMITEKDEFVYHEMISNVPFAVNPDIKRVLIIGGGDGGTAREVAKFKHVEVIDMVEIDERVVRLCEEYFPQTASILSKDSRINLFFEDGVNFVKQKLNNSYDLILVDSTDPIGPGEGLFTNEFYNDCYRILSDDGILINQHESPFFDKDKVQMKRAHKRIKSHFPIARVYMFHQTIYASGLWLFGFASKKFDPIKDHKPLKWEEFNLKTRYYNSDLHKAAFCLPNYIFEELNKD
jgi:spermidine synthase